MANYGYVTKLPAMLADLALEIAARLAEMVGYRDAAQAAAQTAINAPGTQATSATSFTLALGSKAFTLAQAGKLFPLGATVSIARTSDPTKVGYGTVTAFADPVLTVNVIKADTAAGPYTDWTISLAGTPGRDGSTILPTSAAIVGGVCTLDLNNGNYFNVTVNADITSISVSNPPASAGQIYVRLTYFGPYSITLPSAWKPAGTAAPVLTVLYGQSDLLRLTTADGGATWLMEQVGAIPTSSTPTRLHELQMSGASSYFPVPGAVRRKGASIYATASLYNASSSTYRGHVAKYALDGTLQWQRVLYTTADETSGLRMLGVDADSAGNVYVLVSHIPGVRLSLIKLNSAGTTISRTYLHNQTYDAAAGFYEPLGSVVRPMINLLAIDGSDNIHVLAMRVSTRVRAVVAKYNSALTLQWSRELTLAAEDIYPIDIAIDAAGNVYAAAVRSASTVVWAKWDSAGALQWKSEEVTGRGPGSVCAPDASGRIAGTRRGYNGVMLIDSAGALLWNRTLSGDSITAIKALISGTRVVVLGTANNQPCLVALNVSDGSLAWAINFTVVSRTDGVVGCLVNDLETDAFGNLYLSVSGSTQTNSTSMQTLVVLPHYVNLLAGQRFGNGMLVTNGLISAAASGEALQAAAGVSEQASSLTQGTETGVAEAAAAHPITRYLEL
jgi:hypothetical protein